MTIVWLIAVLSALLIGYAAGRWSASANLPRHQHIWAPWEQFQLSIVSPSGERLYKQAAQQRDCLDCGYREQERIHA